MEVNYDEVTQSYQLAWLDIAANESGYIIQLANDLDNNFEEIVIEFRALSTQDLEQEAPAEIPCNKPPESWPERGQIEFKDVSFRYRSTLPPVLKNITMEIKAAEKIGELDIQLTSVTEFSSFKNILVLRCKKLVEWHLLKF